MKKAFTLAEILITLSIIGVIASMTIPSIIQDIQEAQYKTAWKKAFANVSQAAKLQKLKEGQIYTPTLGKYMHQIKDCAISQTLPECAMTCPAGWGCGFKPTSPVIFITPDGMQWGDFQAGSDKWCAVDVNGPKGPNKANQDTFAFCIMPDARIIPDTHPDCMRNFSPNAKTWLYQ